MVRPKPHQPHRVRRVCYGVSLRGFSAENVCRALSIYDYVPCSTAFSGRRQLRVSGIYMAIPCMCVIRKVEEAACGYIISVMYQVSTLEQLWCAHEACLKSVRAIAVSINSIVKCACAVMERARVCWEFFYRVSVFLTILYV